MVSTKNIRWSEDLIEKKILEVKEALEINRMPTQAEMQNYFHNCSLTNAIHRNGGSYYFSEKLGLSKKECETSLGKSYEKAAYEILMSKGHIVRKMPQNFPYDLLVDDCVKIDVKASRMYKGTNGNFYSYNLEKPYITCDIFMLFKLDSYNSVKETYIVPGKFVVANSQISIGEKKSKYDRFIDRFDYISTLSDFLDTVI